MGYNFYCVSGYGWSGSGAVVDLLKEYKGFRAIDSEYPVISEPGGIIDLEIFLIENWHFLRHDKAIRDFLAFCKKLDKKPSKFNLTGINLSEKLSVDFVKESEKFIGRIIDFKYECRSRINFYHLNMIEVFIKKFIWKYFNKNSIEMYFSKPTEEKFVSEIKKFHSNIFNKFFNEGYTQIILDQAIPINHSFRSIRYFENCKMIIVDRDPRDVYVDLIKNKGLIGPEISNLDKESVNKYIRWYHDTRSINKEYYNSASEKQILKLKFEDLILRYDETINTLNNFIGRDIEHIDKLKYFNPEHSNKNIGLWKKIENQNLIKFIRSEISYPYFD